MSSWVDVDAAVPSLRREGKENDEDAIPEGVPILTKYESADVAVPDSFLTALPADACPVTTTTIDWAKTALPENCNRYAAVLDNVLSPSECRELIRLAEASVPEEDRGRSGPRSWRPAMVNVGGGYEVLQSEYRNSDRIIWDQQEVADRIWERCLLAPGVRERLEVIDAGDPALGYISRPRKGRGPREDRWELRRLNKRMRFLKYGKGQFFRSHCDAEYREPGTQPIKTLFTLHLYLNDSVAEAGESSSLVGGATSFWSIDQSRKLDVNPKAGRVLIFQHSRLYHSGDDVLEGTKYTMRTDIMYEKTR